MDDYKPHGIIEITGEHDSGKTLAALFVNYKFGVPLKRIAFFHDDVKYPGYPPDSFGLFIDLVKETKGMKLFDYRQYVLKRIETIKSGQFDIIIFDTWAKFGESIKNFVVANRYQFRAKDEFIMQHDLKVVGAQTWKDAHNEEASMAGMLSNLCDCLIVTSHLKDHYSGNAKTGKQVDELGKAWDKICNMRLWLRHNRDSGVPVTLVLKRIHRPGVDENGLPTTIDVLPRRIKPLQDERSIWDAINRYWQNPVGGRTLTEDEQPTPFELSILNDTLTEDQKEVWRAELAAQKQRDKEEQEFLSTDLEEVRGKVQLYKHLPPNVILDTLVQQGHNGYTITDIIQMMG